MKPGLYFQAIFSFSHQNATQSKFFDQIFALFEPVLY